MVPLASCSVALSACYGCRERTGGEAEEHWWGGQVSFIGSVCGFGMPLKPVQLLWVNLVMDTMGALALATEAPTKDLLDRAPYGRHDHLVNDHMWRNIFVQSSCVPRSCALPPSPSLPPPTPSLPMRACLHSAREGGG